MQGRPFLGGDKPLPHFQRDLIMEIASQAPLIEGVFDKFPSDCCKDIPQYCPHLLRLVGCGKDADRGQKHDDDIGRFGGEVAAQVNSRELVERENDSS